VSNNSDRISDNKVWDLWSIVTVVVVEDNRLFEGAYPTYGAVKNCTLTGNATLRFLRYDIPRPADRVYIAGYKLEQYGEAINNVPSINNFDPLPDTLEIDFVVSQEQINIIKTIQAEHGKELNTISFLSTIPVSPLPGDQFPIVATNLCDESAVVNNVKSRFISKVNAKGMALIERLISCAPNRNNYTDYINKFRQSYKLKNPTPPANVTTAFNSELTLTWLVSDFDRPENVTADDITATSATISWDAVIDAARYQVEFATNSDFRSSSIFPGYHFYNQVGTTIIVNTSHLAEGTSYYVRVLAIQTGTGKESAWIGP